MHQLRSGISVTAVVNTQLANLPAAICLPESNEQTQVAVATNAVQVIGPMTGVFCKAIMW